MIEAAFTRAARFADEHEREITIVSGIWFAISCASYIPFIPIPDVPYITDKNAWMFSGGWNAVWWGFIHPAIDKRRTHAADSVEGAEEESGEKSG